MKRKLILVAGAGLLLIAALLTRRGSRTVTHDHNPVDSERIAVDEPGSDTGEDLQRLEGIGPAYADRLREAGVERVDDLIEKGASDLSERTDIAEARLNRWIQAARE